MTLQQARALDERQGAGEAQRTRVLRSGLPVRPQRGRARSGRGRELEYRLGIAGRLRVVGEQRKVRRTDGCSRESCQRRAVEDALSIRRYRLLDREPRELVPERDRAVRRQQHSGVEALVECRQGVSREHLEQPQLSLRRRDRDRIEQRAGNRPQTRGPREHGIAHRLGDLLAAGKHLRDEERIATRPLVEGGSIDTTRSGQARDGLRRERRELQPHHRCPRSELAEHLPQRVQPTELGVPIAGDQHHRKRPHPTPQQPQHIERRLVCPVHVLQHDDRRRAPRQLPEERPRDLVRQRPVHDQLLQLAADGLRDIQERP